MVKNAIKITFLIILAALLTARVALDIVIENTINTQLAENPNVDGGIDDVDIWLLCGRFKYKGLDMIFKSTHQP